MWERAGLLVVVAVGHAGFTALALNMLHGFGFKGRAVDPVIKGAFPVAVIATPAAGLWLLFHPWLSWPAPIRAYAACCVVMALLVLPACTILRLARKRPAGITGRSTELDLAGTWGVEALVGDGSRSWALRLPGNDSLRLRREDWIVEVPGLPDSLAGLSIVQVTDLHFAHCYRPRFFEAVADEVGRRQADLVFFTGDLIDDPECSAWIAPIFSRMTGRFGQFAILGNHDYRHDVPAILGEVQSGGFEDLEGRWSRIDIGGSSLAIGGTSHPWGPCPDPSRIPPADFRILLSHSPDMLYRASAWGVDLMLSGHNHGGQIRLPVVGPILMPSRFSRRFDQGFFRHDRTLLYVSRGVGGKDPIRYGSPPEITRFVLQPTPRAGARRNKHSTADSAQLAPAGR